MAGYLFDTNIWSHAFDGETFVTSRIQKLKNSQIYLSSVVWGEVVFGAKSNTHFNFDEYKKFIYSNNPLILPIDEHVAEMFGALKAVIFNIKSVRTLRTKSGRASLLKNPISAKEMGIDENDLWLAAQAIAYNLILITNDRMRNILQFAPKELKYKIWQ
ncbi:MAG: PIN domain-containing protein [Sedimentisphaerales bacterium]|nr:PIN domain-containing protein [Sedimentisphaerales bacterium]